MQAGIILTQPIETTLAMAEVIAHISNLAIEWAEEYLDSDPSFEFATFRAAAYDNACNLFDGEDGCILNCEECLPSDFEAEVLVASYVYAALAFISQHTVIKTK